MHEIGEFEEIVKFNYLKNYLHDPALTQFLNPHGPRQFPSALGKKGLETKLEIKY